MKRYQFEMGQRLEVFGLPEIAADSIYNGHTVKVVDMPGWHPFSPNAYAVQFEDGRVEAAIERYLRPAPPKDRGNLDNVTSWAVFDAMTGMKSITFRRQNKDY